VSEIKICTSAKCAFIKYRFRGAAESAVDKLYGRLVVKGCFLDLDWAKDNNMKEPQNLLGAGTATKKPNTGGQTYAHMYPSMRPDRMGAAPEGRKLVPPGLKKRKGMSGGESGAKKQKVEKKKVETK